MIVNPVLMNFNPTYGLTKKYSDKFCCKIRFGSKVIQVIYGENNSNLNDKIDEFEKSKSNATPIGQGKFATVYKFNNSNEVIKSSNTDTFTNEAKSLYTLPKDLKNTQKLISYVKTEDGNYHMISIFQNGENPHPNRARWTNSHFHCLMDNIYKLDKSGINHMDLNRKNCLLESGGKVSFIDYQWAEQFEILEQNPQMLRTKFELPSNLLIFEKAGLTSYLAKSNNSPHGKETLKLYLKNKADFLERQRNYILSKTENSVWRPENIENAIKYSKICSDIYRNPDDKIINLEAKKLQFLYSHRQISTLIDSNLERDAQILSVPTLYLYTIENVKDFIKSAKKLELQTTDKTQKAYAQSQQEYGNFYLQQFKNWSVGTFDWILRNAKGETSYQDDDLNSAMFNISEKNLDPFLDSLLGQDYSNYSSGYGMFSKTYTGNAHNYNGLNMEQLFAKAIEKQAIALSEGKNALALNYILHSINLAKIIEEKNLGYFYNCSYEDFIKEQSALAVKIFKGEINGND